MFGKVYSPVGKHTQLKSAIRNAACRAVGVANEIRGPVSVVIECWMPKAKSNTSPRWWSTKKPDVDNIAKCILDGLNDSGVWGDDAQVVCCVVSKIDSPAEEIEPRTFVTISELPQREKPPKTKKTKKTD